MKNRIAVLTFSALLFTLSFPAAKAQQAGTVYRIGYLTMRPIQAEQHWIGAFQQRLQELGYVEGKNLLIEFRRAPVGQPEKLREGSAELVRLKVNVIVASGDTAAHIAKKATPTIPIVFAVSADPVGTGLVQSLARPGGNVTGLSDLHSVLVTKRLELLKEVVPSASRIAVLVNPASRVNSLQLKDVQEAAPAFGLTILSVAITGPDDIEPGFAVIKKGRAGAILVLGGNPAHAANRRRIINLAAKDRLPTFYTIKENVEAGGLMSYGTNFTDLWRRAAVYVDKILKGAKPADLPVEQPTKFELVINLKTAKQIGLTIPPSVLYRADRVIR